MLTRVLHFWSDTLWLAAIYRSFILTTRALAGSHENTQIFSAIGGAQACLNFDKARRTGGKAQPISNKADIISYVIYLSL